MSFAQVYSAQPVYLDASLVTVEADLSKGLHSFSVVGLPDKAVEESRERVAVAIKNSGFSSPKHSNKRVLISLAPADLRKEGTRFDLPIALAYLLASEEVCFPTENILFLGELSLQGELRPVHGLLSIARFAKERGFHTLVVPKENAKEAALIEELTVLPAENLLEVVDHFNTKEGSVKKELEPQKCTAFEHFTTQDTLDLSDIRGQDTAKRGLEIAAAGRHNIGLFGPPGTGKTMLARALRGILPPLTFEEALETTAIHSIAGTLSETIITAPPFRSPHHTSSHIAIAGGGSIPRPGEVTLAHRGVLFLDEFPEFERRVIETLREPLEDKIVSISRAKGSTTFPANFILVAAMNPNTERGEGRISELDKEKLKKKISGPVIDRIDMWIEVTHIEHEKLKITKEKADDPQSPKTRERIQKARLLQQKRFTSNIKTNSDMSVRDIENFADMEEDAETLLTQAAKVHKLSPRSYHRTIKLARTIADLAGEKGIQKEHILEALTYRPKELFE